MIQASFSTDGSRITAFTVAGHSGLAPSGEDILCAAVTSAVRLTECAVNDVLGLQAGVKVNDQDASITLKLPRNLEGEADQVSQTLLAALMVYLVRAAGGVSRTHQCYGGVTNASDRTSVLRT